MKRLAVLILALVLSGCAGGGGVTVVARGDIPDAVFGDDSADSSRVIFFVSGNRLAAAQRDEKVSGELAKIAMDELLRGPTESERERGLSTAIPNAVRLLKVPVVDRVARVDLSREFVAGVEGPDQAGLLRLAQVVYTLTELQEVNAVQLFIAGEQWRLLDQRGREISEPVARPRFASFAPVGSADSIEN